MTAPLRIACNYDPEAIPAQAALRRSRARIFGYGGAMAGGKSRTLGEIAFDWALEYPGIYLPVIRQVHTSITQTTRRTFMEQVLPSELRSRPDLVRIVDSQGRDFIEFLWNKSQIHFIGLDNPMKLFSAEIGGALFDESQEISEADVLTVGTRLRQRCAICVQEGRAECSHMPHRMGFTFNPSYPGHWLDHWFRLGAKPTEFGFERDEVFATEGGDISMGDMEFFRALPTDNPFVSKDYIDKSLAGLTPDQRKRYRDGEWIHLGGSGFFDPDALNRIRDAIDAVKPLLVGEPQGDPSGQTDGDRPRLVPARKGRLEMYRRPVRYHITPDEVEVKAHRYVIGVDTSSGMAADYSAVQVIDADEIEQVAQWQGKVDTDKLATIAFLLACVYNGAVLVPERTGGWGFATALRIKTLIGKYEGNPDYKPRLYTERKFERLSSKFTDVLGWDTNVKTRAMMLDALEEAVRDGSLQIHGVATLIEMEAFALRERTDSSVDFGPPRARAGSHDDLVIALAIATLIATRMPRHMRAPRQREVREPLYGAAGY